MIFKSLTLTALLAGLSMVASAQTPPTVSPAHQNQGQTQGQTQGQAQTGGRNMTPIRMSMPKDSLTAQDIGHLSGTEPLHISISLPYAQPAAMQAFVDDVSNPSSPNYRHFITPDEVGQRFGQSTATVQNIANYLSAQGMTIKLIGKNHLSILADATAAQAEAAFNTTIDEFKSSTYTPPRGKLYSFTSPPQLPTSLAPFVIRVGGLESFTHPHPLDPVTPQQLRSVYDISNSYASTSDGQGITVAITNYDGFSVSNASQEYSYYGIPLPPGGFGSNIQVVTIDGGSGSSTPEGEGDLDIQAVLGVAPACNLIIYDGVYGDFVDILTKEADDNLADVLSESYVWFSSYQDEFLAAHNLHLSMNAQGMTYCVASGDTGTQFNGVYPDEEPEILSVGGTSLTPTWFGARGTETAWNLDAYGDAGGGGWNATTDSFNVLPSWQKGKGVPTDIPYRLVPDVASDADPNTGFLVYYADIYGIPIASFLQVGGTSFASPTFAAGLAYVEQQSVAHGGAKRFGRINDLLYAYNGNPRIFFDVTSGYIGALPNGQGAYAGPGWDFATGWGVLDHNGFLNALLYFPVLNNPGNLMATAGVSVSYSVPASTQDPSDPVLVGSVSAGPSWVSYNGTTVTLNPPLGTKPGDYPFTITVVDQNNTTLTTSLDLLAVVSTPTLKSVNFASSTVASGSNAVLYIQLTGPAPVGGLTLNLAPTNSYLNPPTTVVIPAGALEVTYTPSGASAAVPGMLIAAGSVKIPEISGVTVTLNKNAAVSSLATTTTSGSTSKSFTASIRVLPPSVTAINVPANVNGGANFNGTLTLSAPAPTGGLVVYLASSYGTVASLPATVTVPAGATAAPFAIQTYSTTIPVSVTLSGYTTGTQTFSTSFNVLPVVTEF